MAAEETTRLFGAKRCSCGSSSNVTLMAKKLYRMTIVSMRSAYWFCYYLNDLIPHNGTVDDYLTWLSLTLPSLFGPCQNRWDLSEGPSRQPLIAPIISPGLPSSPARQFVYEIGHTRELTAYHVEEFLRVHKMPGRFFFSGATLAAALIGNSIRG